MKPKLYIIETTQSISALESLLEGTSVKVIEEIVSEENLRVTRCEHLWETKPKYPGNPASIAEIRCRRCLTVR